MATITLTNPQFYYAGQLDPNPWVGFTSTHYRTVRYEFDAPSGGASHIELKITQALYASGSNAEHHDYCFYVSTSSTSHTNVNSDSPYTGKLTMTWATDGTSYSVFTGEADILLTPNTKYYVWIFSNSVPFTDRYTNYDFESAVTTVTTSGGAGLVYIDNGSGFAAYQVYIDNGTGWDLYTPYIDNGITWDMCN